MGTDNENKVEEYESLNFLPVFLQKKKKSTGKKRVNIADVLAEDYFKISEILKLYHLKTFIFSHPLENVFGKSLNNNQAIISVPLMYS